MDKPEKIKIGCCPFCGGNIKRANMKAFSRQSQIYGFNLALDGVDATWGALIYNFSAELELSAEQTAKLTTLGEEYDKMIRSFREADRLRKISTMMATLKQAADLAGLEVVGRVIFKDKATGKEYR